MSHSPTPWLYSFGRRHGRPFRDSERQRAEAILPQLAITDPTQPVFPADRETWLEIGFGGGEHLATQAERHPEIGFIGCEPFMNGVVKLLRLVEIQKLNNVRIWHDDARLLVEHLPDHSLQRVFLLFPDPWPKLRHNKRRIVNTAFLDLLARKLRSGGELRIATDHDDYAAWILERCAPHPAFTALAKNDAERRLPPADWVPTRYQQKAAEEGRAPWFLRYERI